MKTKKFEQTLSRYFAVLGAAPRTNLRGKKGSDGKRARVFRSRAGFDIVVTERGAVFYSLAWRREGNQALR